jgi:hypothetical protein
VLTKLEFCSPLETHKMLCKYYVNKDAYELDYYFAALFIQAAHCFS